MNYIGSKKTLLPQLVAAFEDCCPTLAGVTFVDGFAGTGVVAQTMRQMGAVVHANDWQYYSYIELVAGLVVPPTDATTTDQINSWFSKACQQLQMQSLTAHRFVDEYCEGGDAQRLYFSLGNGQAIAGIREKIAEWRNDGDLQTGIQGLTVEVAEALLIRALLRAADKVANTASVYGAFLKQIKKTAQKPLTLVSTYEGQTGPAGQAYCADIGSLATQVTCQQVDLLYLDPPYNHRQYSANYHILETIARWDLGAFEPRGRTGLRPADAQRSAFCQKTKAAAAMGDVIRAMDARATVVSYNNEGLLTADQLRDIMAERYATIEIREIPYTRYRADRQDQRNHKADSTVEWIVVGTNPR